jgi:transposase InsO family protein
MYKDADVDRQVLVPRALLQDVLHFAHLPPCGAHIGVKPMIQNVSREFCWPTVALDCARYVSECLSCSAVKHALTQKTRPLQLFPPSGPWEFVCADILGLLPMTPNGNRFVLVFSDRFSKFTVSIAMRTVTADEVAEQFVSKWVAHFGVPVVLLTDNGPQLVSKFLQQVSAILGVQQRFTSAYHPATNGQVERFNRSLLTMLCHYVGANRSWDKVLGAAMAAYNATVHTSTGLAPHEFLRRQCLSYHTG